VLPVHELVPVDIFLPGCPPSAQRIRGVLEALLRDQKPPSKEANQIRFG